MPVFYLLNSIGLIDSRIGLICVYAASGVPLRPSTSIGVDGPADDERIAQELDLGFDERLVLFVGRKGQMGARFADPQRRLAAVFGLGEVPQSRTANCRQDEPDRRRQLDSGHQRPPEIDELVLALQRALE